MLGTSLGSRSSWSGHAQGPGLRGRQAAGGPGQPPDLGAQAGSADVQRRGRWATAWLSLPPLLSILGLVSSCGNDNALVLAVRPPPGVTLTQYALTVQERDSRTIVYQSGVQPIDPSAAGRNLSEQPLRIGLKLTKGGKFLVHVRASTTTLAPDGTTPNPRDPEYFYAGFAQVGGTVEQEAALLAVDPMFDRDFDHFPDVMTWQASSDAARARYQTQPELLDCIDSDPAPGQTPLPVPFYAVQINPLAVPKCGLAIDIACGDKPMACPDKDGDGVAENLDCEDNDPKRFPGNARPRNCCQCTDRKSCATNHAKLTDLSQCQPARCDSTLDYDCTGVVTPCFVDDDCDGFSPNDPVASLRDCDDTNPLIHPGAAKNCADSSKDWACDGAPKAGCVACDLDGDGFERNDPTNSCPSLGYTKPIDCDDNDRGVFPGSTTFEGVDLITRDLKGKEGAGSVAAALRGLCRNSAAVFQTALVVQDADCDGNARNGCPIPSCDGDGDGFPNSNAGCNPSGLPVDCNDTNPQIFPGAPEKCGDGVAQGCVADRACSNDADKDGYSSDYDCDDSNANVHPFATEKCNGVDDDCDGLVDEGNPDVNGAALTKSYTVAGVTRIGITTCTDDNDGECGKPDATTGALSGRCVCSGVVPTGAVDAANRTLCPTQVAGSATGPKCFGAKQPSKQTCDADNPRDDDCNGSTSDVAGTNLLEKGDVCGLTQGECKTGLVAGCDRSKTNAFAGLPNFPSSKRFLVCSAAAVGPVAEICDGKDNNCNLQTDETCALAGATTPACCLLTPPNPQCTDLSNNLNACGSCTFACNANAANQCVSGSCKCGANPQCGTPTPYCNTTATPTCTECLQDSHCTAMGKNKCLNKTSCVACVSSSDCGTPGLTACDPASHSCVECFDDSTCPAMSHCNTTTNKCVECASDAQCGAGKQCDLTTNKCVTCVNDAGCMAGQHCNPATHSCVGCISDAQCLADNPLTPKCNLATLSCVQCNMKSDCTGPGTSPQCVNNSCVACTMDAHCGAGKYCDTTSYACVDCLNNTQCTLASASHCDVMTHMCAICSGATDCALIAGKPQCLMGTGCVQCRNAGDCAGATSPICDGAHSCVPCTANGECDTKNVATPVCVKAGGMAGACVVCSSSTQCDVAAARPICDTGSGKCLACNNNGECEGKDVNTPLCSGGACLPCGQSTDCTVAATRPICAGGACRKCNSNGECNGRATTKPKCNADGTCSACTANSDCNFAQDKPVCDMANGCTVCATDTECMGSIFGDKCDPLGSGKCMCFADGDCTAPGSSMTCNIATGVCNP